MIRNRRNTFLVHLALVAYLVAGVVNLSEVVLCLGDDGHIAVERATLDGSCETAVLPSALALTRGDADVSFLCHCGPCVDVTLATIDAASTRVLSLQDVAPQLQLVALHLPSFLLPIEPPATKRPAAFLAPPAVSALTSLRSVILLI